MTAMLITAACLCAVTVSGQLLPQMGSQVQVKITDQPFAVANAQHLNQIVWTTIGNTIKEQIYCVSEAPVSQLRFVCTDCEQRNITDMVSALNSAQDLTRSAGFPTVALKLPSVNPTWTGATVLCQAALNGGTVDSAPAVVDVRFLRSPHVSDATGQAPVLIANQGYRFYVECIRGADGQCQASGRRKTLKCAIQAHPPATTFRWLKNGVPISGTGQEMSIGTEMIGHSMQCSANNGLYQDAEMPTSQAVQIDPYSSARIVQDNFQTLQGIPPFQAGNRIEMNQQVSMQCAIEGNPRPVVFWKMRRSNGQVVDANCPQGFDGQYQEIPTTGPTNIARLNAICQLRVANYSYSGQYWCSACSLVSQGAPECSPSLDAPGTSTLSMVVQGPPMAADVPATIEQQPNSNNAVVTVHYCAEPVPRPPREVVFSIDQNDIQIGQHWENFKFDAHVQNASVPSCFIARLLVAPVREQDEYRQIVLKVQNQYGAKQLPVSLESLLGGASSLSGRLSPWWIVLFVFLGALAALACLTVFCVRRRLLCFNTVKKEQEPYGETKAKANLNVRSTLYSDDAMPRAMMYQQSEVITPSSTRSFSSSTIAVGGGVAADSGASGASSHASSTSGGFQARPPIEVSRPVSGNNHLPPGVGRVMATVPPPSPPSPPLPPPPPASSLTRNERDTPDYGVYLSREAVV